MKPQLQCGKRVRKALFFFLGKEKKLEDFC